MKEDSNFAAFAKTALRSPRRGVFEQLLTQHLISATFNTDPLKIIIHICNAAFMTKPEDVKNLDLEQLKTIARAASTLSTPNTIRINQRRLRQPWDAEIIKLSWGFKATEENWKRYIEPWYVGLNFYSGLLPKHEETRTRVKCGSCGAPLLNVSSKGLGCEEKEKAWKLLMDKHGKERESKVVVCPCGEEIENAYSLKIESCEGIKAVPRWQFFFEATRCLKPSGYQRLRNSFTNWALPIAQKAKAELSRLVTPSIYSDVLKTMSGTLKGEPETGSVVDQGK